MNNRRDIKDVEDVKVWLQDVIVGLNLCPFAKAPWEKGLIRIQASRATDEEQILQAFLDELNELQMHRPSEISTTLLCFTDYQGDFITFNNLVGSCELILEELGLDELFQLVAFHPNFQFANLTADARANLVNSSPMPLIHIIRKMEIAQVIKEMNDGEKISYANEKRLEQLELADLKKLFPWKFY